MITKICPKCERELPISSYWIDRSRPDGRFRMCRDCATTEKMLRRNRYAARYYIGSLVNKGLLPKASTLQCSVPGCTKTPEWHHYLGWEREHWAHVLPICRSHNMRRFHEQGSLFQ
jgi:hypothetical protein